MNVVILQNPRSGRGHAARVAHDAVERLKSAGHSVTALEAGPASNGPLAAALKSAYALVIAGGDGTLHHAAPIAAAANVPIYHLPLGTENLFAREFGMDRSPETLLRALDARRIVPIDMATCNGRHFLLMCGIGFDAAVVARLAAKRTGAIRRIDYLVHILGELLTHKPPRLTITADGKPLVTDTQGLAIVANCRQYARNLNPLRHAVMTDGLLDVIFLPCRGRLGVLRWLATITAGKHLTSPKATVARAAHVRITRTPADFPYQLDGEAVNDAPGQPADGVLEVRTIPGALSVLTPES
jgi:diacylglycerol kinase (ATP)